MLRVAMLGKWHVHAEGYANDFNAQADSKVTCVWDDDEARGSEWAKRLNVPFYTDPDLMLEKEDFDAVCVCSATNRHKELFIKAANAGKHIFTEKVMCLNTDDCDEATEAILKNDVKFSISFPHKSFAHNLLIKRVIDEGMLGQITFLRARICHDGALKGWLPEYWFDPETTGGGAMMDLGAHPMYLSAWLLGKPVRVFSSFQYATGRAVDDDALSIIEFESGARASVETSLIAPRNPQMMEVYGTKGAIICQNGKLTLSTNDHPEWHEPTLPEALPSPLRMFTDSVLYDRPNPNGLTEARLLTQMMQNAYEAAKTGKSISF